MAQGHIRLSRAILDWRWADDPVMMYFWIRILLMANWKDKEWRDKVIKRGSFVASVSSLSGQLGLSTQQVRTCLERLRAGGEIKTNTTNTHTLITICKYDDYQSTVTNEQQTDNKPTTNEEQTDNKRITTTKEYKEYNTSDTNVSSYSILKERREEKKKEKEEDTDVSSKKEAVDFPFIQRLWNESMIRTKKIPRVASLSQARKEKVKLRIAEMGGWENAKGTIAECFRKINDSDFCNGENDQVWVATFDWFFSNDKNWLKVFEGNYDNRQRKSQLEIMAENYQKASEYYEQRHRGYGDGPSPYGGQTGSGPYGPDEQ